MKKSMYMICIAVFLIAICISLSSIHSYADTYSYDEMGRIKEAVHDDGSKTVYEYDDNGNMLSVKTVSKVRKNQDDDFWPFTDVKIRPGNWAYEGILYVYKNGIMNGDKDKDGDGYTTFRPHDIITRAQFVTTLYRLDGAPKVSDRIPFTDVPGSVYYTEAVRWAYKNQITTGTGKTTFSPNIAISREQMATMLKRYAEYKGYNISAKSDISKIPDYKKVSNYAKDALSWANAKGIIQGKEINGKRYLDPKASATRQECATLLKRFCLEYVEK